MNEYELIMKKNNEFRQQAVDNLAAGAAKDYAEYRELVGVIRGLNHSNLNIQDLLRKLKENDDD